MGNPDPIQTPEFLARQRRVGDRPLGDPISCRFPVEVDAALRRIDDRQAYIRAAVEEKLRADGLLSG